MSFYEQLKKLSDNAKQWKDHIHTEEATKTSLVMPFLKALGYDPNNPLEVIPEYIADIGEKKGEKVDFAIRVSGNPADKPAILIECKTCNHELTSGNCTQLRRYFNVEDARFAILTNGIQYKFYTDLDKHNTMDDKPFFEIDLFDMKEHHVKELAKFIKEDFDLDTIISKSKELKYTRDIKRILNEELNEPSEKFVKFFVSEVYSGRMTESVKVQFTEIVKDTFRQFIKDKIYDRLRAAENADANETSPKDTESTQPNTEQQSEENESRIVTTEEETQGYYIVKSIVARNVDLSRVIMRDRVNFCGILLDDNQLKPICKLYFNDLTDLKVKFYDDPSKENEKVSLATVDDLYQFEDRLRGAVQRHETGNSDESPGQLKQVV